MTGEVGEFVVTAPMPSMPLAALERRRRRALPRRLLRHVPRRLAPGRLDHDLARTAASSCSGARTRRSTATACGSARRRSTRSSSASTEVADSLVVGVELPDGAYYDAAVRRPGRRRRRRRRAARAARRAILRRELSPRHVPDEIVEAPAIPRTLTGKKLEVPVKRDPAGRGSGARRRCGIGRPPRRARRGTPRVLQPPRLRGRDDAAIGGDEFVRLGVPPTAGPSHRRRPAAAADQRDRRGRRDAANPSRAASTAARSSRSTCPAPDARLFHGRQCGFAASPPASRSCSTPSAIERVDVLGYSFGGVVAQELAYRRPRASAD